MFKPTLSCLLMLLLSGTTFSVLAATYGSGICKLPEYTCVKVEKGQSWASLFPDPEQRMMVKKINRMNTAVHAGMTIAVPRNIEQVDFLSLAPFPDDGTPNTVLVDMSELAWGAYDDSGNLIKWGPVSGGKSYCKDVGRSCKTIMGSFTFYSKKGAGCVSSKYPVPRGGAPMPYCMHFKGGYAMHGSPTVPGYNASHGCLRMFTEDAQWLNQNFVQTGSTRVKIVP